MNGKRIRAIALFFAFTLLYEVFFPTVAYALTGGPSQPEVQSFEPVGTTEMVDLFSGDFNYNIPLLDVEGYPINISYHSGITMDQEATWVGLGWNINPGAINRNMRGLPDDFKGDAVQKDLYVKPNYTFGVNFGASFELFGLEKLKYISKAGASLSVGMGIYYNNYKGVGFEQSITPAINAGNKLKLGGSLALSSNSQSGLTIAPNLSFGVKLSSNGTDKANSGGVNFSVGESFNSRSGMKTMTFSKGIDFSTSTAKKTGGVDKDGKPIYAQEADGKHYENSGMKTGVSNGGSNISSACQSYVPQITMPMNNTSISVKGTMGAELFGANPNMFVSGYFSMQAVDAKSISKGGYGYMYSHKKSSDDVLMDLNREKDGAYSKNNPILPITNYTYDLYAVNGQGIGGMYRPHRSDIGVLFDDDMTTTSTGGSMGVEVGVGNLVHNGFNVDVNYAESQSGKWTDANDLAKQLDFVNPDLINDPLYEPVYFANAGEKVPVEDAFLAYNNVGEAVRADLTTEGKTVRTEGGVLKYTGVNETGKDVIQINKNGLRKQTRTKRNQPISYITAADSAFCLNEYMNTYTMNSAYNSTPTAVSRLDAYRKGHHITEITALNTNGSRYVYGIAAYNNTQTEYTFTNDGAGNVTTGLASYNPSLVSSKRGQEAGAYDGYFTATTLPAYAHSYLLTAVLSPDYVDVNQNGIDNADLGNYTKINYTRINSGCKWRTPCGSNQASYSEGLKTDPYDNKASFIYGEKEIWLVQSIESKNYVAEFNLVQREDGLYVNGVNGGINTSARSYRIESISLYSKQEKIKNGANAVPIKTVHFQYDYSLCPNVENNTRTPLRADGTYAELDDTSYLNANRNHGKLTLRKIYFTYGLSQKSKFSAYEFNYSSVNPSYNIKGYDRWGNYKFNSSALPNAEYPYVEQTASTQDSLRAWSLEQIKLPSGGTIQVNYEADDYAYVQNKQAMQMFKVVGFSNTMNGTPENVLYKNDKIFSIHDYVFVQINDSLVQTSDDFKKRYLSGIDNLFFNFLVDLTTGAKKEYVRGYAHVLDGGLTSTPNRAWVRVEKVDIGDGSDVVSPFSKAAWQYARMSTPQLVYPGSDLRRNSGDWPVAVLKMLVGVAADLVELLEGFNNKLLGKLYGRTVTLDHSWIRLNSGTKKKIGGGVRVKQIQLSDNWQAMGGTGEADFAYGQQYDYTTQENYNGTPRTISSGVAAYEPLVGNDENPWRQPVSFSKDNYLVPDETFYAETPFGESFFPSASVGYSKVTVRNLQRTNVRKHATGKVVHEFYTAYDFPTITKQKEIEAVAIEPSIIDGLFSFKVEHSMTASTGYLIELNDMHGKPKAQWVYAEPNPNDPNGAEKRLSGVQYFYKTDDNNPSHLNNFVSVVNTDGTISNATVGVDVDMVADMREQRSSSYSGGVQINTEAFVAGIFPVIIPVILPSYSSETTLFRSAVITRVVNRYGILDHTVAYEDGATITTNNLMFDGQTGEILLTKTQNEYKDNSYNLTYPAHWTYDGMGPAYKNIGAIFHNVIHTITIPGDSMSIAGGLKAKNFFFEGDEVMVRSGSFYQKYWVMVASNGQPYFVDQSGAIATSLINVDVTILRSGRRNMQNTPVLQVSTVQQPTTNVGGFQLAVDATKLTLDAKAEVFSSSWIKNCLIQANSTTCLVNERPKEMANIFSMLLSTGQILIGNADGTVKNINTPFPTVYDTTFIKADRTTCSNPHNFTITNYITTGTFNKRNLGITLSACGISYVATISYPDTGCAAGKIPVSLDSIWATNVSTMNVVANFGSGCKVTLQINMENMTTPISCYQPCTMVKQTGGNPYLDGTKGNWRKKKEYLYLDNRTTASATPDIRVDGFYKTFSPYWKINAGKWYPDTTSTNWTWTSEVVNYDPNGNEIENRDPLNRYSSALFSSKNVSLPIAVANNAQRREIGFESFEENNFSQSPVTPFIPNPVACPTYHWNFAQTTTIFIDTLQYHTGKQSLRMMKTQKVMNQYPLFNNGSDTSLCKDCTFPFSPTKTKYVVSGWVRTSAAITDVSDRNAYIIISYLGSAITDTLKPTGSIIEDWQRIEGVITVPSSAYQIQTTLFADGVKDTTWFDDVRFCPFNANMKTYVYDMLNYRLSAELDENNYATFYEYDEQGSLKRVKRETENGIATIKESRNSTIKKF